MIQIQHAEMLVILSSNGCSAQLQRNHLAAVMTVLVNKPEFIATTKVYLPLIAHLDVTAAESSSCLPNMDQQLAVWDLTEDRLVPTPKPLFYVPTCAEAYTASTVMHYCLCRKKMHLAPP